MIRYTLSRLAWSAAVIAFAVSATFAMIYFLPADPARTLAGPHATPETLARLQQELCLDRGLAGQYGCYVARMFRGDLGTSVRTQAPVSQILAARLGATLQLALVAIALQVLVAIPLAVLAAMYRYRAADRVAGFVALVCQSAPPFFAGALALYLFAFRSGWFPVGGYGSGILGRLHHAILPAFTVALIGMATYIRVLRAALIDHFAQDYLRTARAKGLPERHVIARHALRNALPPVVTLLGVDFGLLMAGAAVTEHIFAWPGLGREALHSVLALDTPVILGIVLVAAVTIAIANLASDLALAWLDPRVRLPADPR